ncbi:MAG: CPXCG motif-containing cysteine-rich protein [Acidimicrobiia bacterium]|nr:CPXCG motif-containing cysteine-rich protein [Acidimicrobiia bacterium]
MEESRRVDCPYCGQRFYVFVDVSAGNQRVIEDCQICCQPIELRISIEDGEIEEILADPAN